MLSKRSISLFSSLALFLALIAMLLSSFAGPTATAEECQTFTETGFTSCRKFLAYWQTHGGLAQQGFPISTVFDEKNADPPAGDGKFHKVQYYQRARFEEHLENAGTQYEVLLGLLGAEQLGSKYGANLPGATSDLPGDCQFFSETGFKTCGIFLEYWRANGGLAQQGFPMSPLFEELNLPPPAGDGKVHRVQYFQRARFEEHTENQPPYNVLLGLLGTEQKQKKYGDGGPAQVTTTAAPTTTVATPKPTTPVPTTAAPTTQPPKNIPASGCLPAISTSGNEVQACVSNSSPSKNSNVTVYGRLIVNGQPVSGAGMDTNWYYKTTTSNCTGSSGGDGIASCTRNIGGATSGYTVVIGVYFSYGGSNYSGSTNFTTR